MYTGCLPNDSMEPAMAPTPPPPPADLYDAMSYCADESIGYLMKRIMVSLVNQADKELSVHDLTSAQWLPLLHLRRVGRSNVMELARWCQIDAGSMTRLLDRLEKKNLCRRVRSTDDRRVVNVELTADGVDAIAQAPAVLARVMNAHLAGFSADEWQALTGYLKRMADNGDALRSAD